MSINVLMERCIIRPARPGDETGIAETQIASWAQTYAGILPNRLLNPWQCGALTEIWRRRLGEPGSRALTFVAEGTDGRIAGFGICGQKRGRILPTSGEVSLLYLRRSIQRRGVGRQLMRTMAATLNERKFRSTGLWVLAGNRNAISFYEALGGIRVSSRTGQFGGHTTRELAYAWPSGLLARSGALKDASAN